MRVVVVVVKGRVGKGRRRGEVEQAIDWLKYTLYDKRSATHTAANQLISLHLS